MTLYQPTIIDKYVYPIVIILFAAVLFYILSMPVWRGEEMVAELKSDCDKRGGVMLEHEKRFGIEYQCASRLD